MKRVAIIVGHDEVQKGAWACPPIAGYEYDYNLGISGLVLKEIAKSGDLDCKVFLRNNGLAACYSRVNEWTSEVPKSCAIELHFNSFDDPSVRGVETLYTERVFGSERLAKILQTEIVNRVFRYWDTTWREPFNRRSKVLKEGERGHYNLSLASCPAVISEPFFGSNIQDCDAGYERKQEYALAIVSAARTFLII